MTETSWAARQPSPTRRWNEPHDQLPLPLFLIALAAAGVLFLAVLLTGQTAMCAIHNDQLRYCPDFQPTTTEETR
jgi:hypothetical protein